MRINALLKIIAFIFIFSFVAIFYKAGTWDNLKLKMVPYMPYFTLENNPLLKGRDADLNIFSDAAANGPRIELSELLSGGPPKDGIPAIDNPEFDTKDTTSFSDDELILGVVINGKAKAYPYGILNWHEIVNDTVGGVPVSITYCPLCDTGISFKRVVNGRVTTFGVSGKLYQSCLVMYDRLTDSLWSQPWGIGVVGEETNSSLERFPTYKTTLGRWLKHYPESKILSVTTGYSRDYFRYPYGTYNKDSSLIFPVRNLDKVEGGIKDIFYIIYEADNSAPFNRFSGLKQAFSFDEIKAKRIVHKSFGNKDAVAILDSDTLAVRVFETNGKIMGEDFLLTDGRTADIESMEEIPATSSFAFVYPAFFK